MTKRICLLSTALILMIFLVSRASASAAVDNFNKQPANDIAISLPSKPSLLTPDGDSILLKWNAVSGADRYRLELNKSSNFTVATKIFEKILGNVTSYKVSGIPVGIRIYWKLQAGNSSGWSPWSNSADFFLSSSNGTLSCSKIRVTYPNTNVMWTTNSTRIVKWTYNEGNSFTVKIELTKDNALSTVIAYAALPGTGGIGSFSWAIPAAQATGTNFKIKLTTSNSKTDTSDAYFTIKKP